MEEVVLIWDDPWVRPLGIKDKRRSWEVPLGSQHLNAKKKKCPTQSMLHFYTTPPTNAPKHFNNAVYVTPGSHAACNVLACGPQPTCHRHACLMAAHVYSACWREEEKHGGRNKKVLIMHCVAISRTPTYWQNACVALRQEVDEV